MALFRKKKIDTNVASQWKLMMIKFRKHKLARVALPLIVILYMIAVFSEFFAVYQPTRRFSDYKYMPPSNIHWTDDEGNLSWPYVCEMKNKVDPATFKRIWTEDTSVKHYVKLFVRAEPYKLWGIFDCDIHLVGLKDYDAPFFLMGTDMMGRDLYSRIMYGSRISLSFGLVSIFFTLVLGLLLGGLSGYLGGAVDTVIQRLIEMIMCIPTIPLWMALAAALPRDWSTVKTYFGMIIIMSFLGWTGLARVVRGKVLSLREEDFTMAARLSGAGHLRTLTKHLLPSFMSYIIVNVSMAIPGSILGETQLSFLGLGIQAPAVSWGTLLRDAQDIKELSLHPWLLWPTAFIIVTVLMFNFLGDGLRDAADPYKN